MKRWRLQVASALLGTFFFLGGGFPLLHADAADMSRGLTKESSPMSLSAQVFETGLPWNWLFSSLQKPEEHRVYVVPGGQSIGIKLHASGILVVGYHLVREGKESISPGERANLHVGDVIDSVNGLPVKSVQQVAKFVEAAGEHKQILQLGYHRKGHSYMAKVRPLFDDETGTYRIGLYIRDSASGVGTLTFYVPTNHGFGALGHVITDVDTGEPIDGKGQIVHAAVTSIDRGESGQPGEKRGLFVNENRILGTIIRNTEFGVFGVMATAPDHGFFSNPIPVARVDEVHPGPAQILTVVKGQKVEAFHVLIVKAQKQESADIKGLVVRVTDQRLLDETGGIVQGMSGSPIIQDGKLVGAITHVFVSDPTEGYGVYAEWMLRHLALNSKELGRLMRGLSEGSHSIA
ncbi:SpoIVB peptidase [Sulfoacidibacillus thermotolerans]|uniref:SpoIVB peptidase n=1 Tax=Sulfoacidibacillus thermotolerans TaxID=1765684 RepID=A0A2U3DBX2_SULT2|nr:SpoIVB peptidase [Sulfoacidibacillus thermotolerans]PWI58773.1 SpoIVB peptidase [Sulfoacidibacillus thermotolerans]